jgi:DNA-binding response OmpR family regulator
MLRVLVVEDDPAIRAMLDQRLSRSGFFVQTAANAHEAMAALLYDLPIIPDVAVLDIRLPGISGVDFADDLRRHFQGIHLIFVTGSIEPQEQEAATRRGSLLVKPFTSQDLLMMIRTRFAGDGRLPRHES